jgi:raffinose/stachyose/melibiose transport system substrate-binding protein
MKKLISILLAVFLVSALAACGSSSNNDKAADAKVKKEIVIWNAGIQDSDDSGKIKKEDLPVYKAIKKFEKANPGYTVRIVDYSMDDVQKAFTAANLAKKGPDMVALWAGSATQVFSKYLVDFKGHLTEDQLKTYDISSLLHANNNSKEPLIGLSTGQASTFVMYYNKDIFKKFNLTVPKTFAQLEKVSATLKKNNVTPMLVGDKDGYDSTWAIGSLLANELGADGIAKLAPAGTEKLTGTNFEKALTTWKNFIHNKNTNPDYLTLSDGDSIQNFVQGNTAMIIHGNWAARDFASMGGKVGVAKIPAISKDAPYANSIVSQPNINLVVTKYSTVKDKTIELAKILSSPEFNKESQAAFYADKTAARLITTIDGFTSKGHNVTGFDSIITGDAASEFYKLIPTVNNGSLKVDDLAKKLDGLNIKK